MYCRVAATFRNVFKTLVLVETATSKALRLFYFMTREERCELAIEKGYTYDPETGFIYNNKNKLINSKRSNYIRIGIKCKLTNKLLWLSAHRFAWYWLNKECGEIIDHINGVKDDNKINNLRNITQQQNLWNQKSRKGCYYFKNKWCAYITSNYKRIHLGTYNTEQEARNAYLQAKEKYHKI